MEKKGPYAKMTQKVSKRAKKIMNQHQKLLRVLMKIAKKNSNQVMYDNVCRYIVTQIMELGHDPEIREEDLTLNIAFEYMNKTGHERRHILLSIARYLYRVFVNEVLPLMPENSSYIDKIFIIFMHLLERLIQDDARKQQCYMTMLMFLADNDDVEENQTSHQTAVAVRDLFFPKNIREKERMLGSLFYNAIDFAFPQDFELDDLNDIFNGGQHEE